MNPHRRKEDNQLIYDNLFFLINKNNKMETKKSIMVSTDGS